MSQDKKLLHARMMKVYHSNEDDFEKFFVEGGRLSQYWDSYRGVDLDVVRAWLLPGDTTELPIFDAVSLEYGARASKWLAKLAWICTEERQQWLMQDAQTLIT